MEPSPNDSPAIDTTNLFPMKIGFMVVIFLISLFFGVLPTKLASCRNGTQSTLMGLANSFSGGLFLAIALIHILPEVVHQYQHVLEDSHDHSHEDAHDHEHEEHSHDAFPLPFVLTFVGYAFILWVDKVLISGHHHHHHSHSQQQIQPSINHETPLIASLEIEDGHRHDHGHGLTPYILLIALGIHSIFEGLALGLMTKQSAFMNLMLSILIHKFAESLSISVSMLKQGTFKEPMIIKLIAVFSLATPLGTLLGMILSQLAPIVSVVCMSLACGSFIYVACQELVGEEFSGEDRKGAKMISFLGGAVFILSLGLIPHEH